MIVGKWGPWTALRGARVRWYFVWRQLARDSPDSREYGRYHLLLTSRLLLMTALASLSPLLSSDWSTLRLARLSLVDIGGGSEAGVVFIRCVDTWHIYRFSSPHYHSFLRALSWHNATLLLTLISIVFMSPDPPPVMTLPQSSKNWDRLTLPGTRTAAGDMRRAVMWVRQCHADTAALTAAPRNILLGSMNSSRHSIVTYLSSSKSKAILFYSMIVCVSLYHGVCWHHLSSPGLAPDTRPVTRTAWAELFDLIFRKPTTQGPRQERGQHYNKTYFIDVSIFILIAEHKVSKILKTNWNITNWPQPHTCVNPESFFVLEWVLTQFLFFSLPWVLFYRKHTILC